MIHDIQDAIYRCQKASIKHWLLTTFVNGDKRIGGWGDLAFHLSGITVRAFADATGMSMDRARRELRRLVGCGALTTERRHRGDMLSFKLPREICDQLAQEALTELRAEHPEAKED